MRKHRILDQEESSRFPFGRSMLSFFLSSYFFFNKLPRCRELSFLNPRLVWVRIRLQTSVMLMQLIRTPTTRGSLKLVPRSSRYPGFSFCFDSSSSSSCSSRRPRAIKPQATSHLAGAQSRAESPPPSFSLDDFLRELRYMVDSGVLTLSMSMSPCRCHLVYASLIPPSQRLPFDWQIS